MLTVTKTLLRFYLVRHKNWIFFRGNRLYVPSGCFTPAGTITSDLFSMVLARIQMEEPWAEIGCGSGQLSLLVAKRGIYVVGSDIDEKCLRAMKINSRANKVDGYIDVVLCDAASCLRRNAFNLVFTNPPYFPMEAEKPVDVSILAGRDLRILKRFLLDSLRISKKSVPVLFSVSSLTGLKIGQPVLCRCLPLERICINIVAKR
jgi:release factor glutamine methyltransferase